MNWYEHTESVVEGTDITIYLDFRINTERTMQINFLDIIIKDRNEKVFILINMSVTSGINISAKVFEELSKYKS